MDVLARAVGLRLLLLLRLLPVVKTFLLATSCNGCETKTSHNEDDDDEDDDEDDGSNAWATSEAKARQASATCLDTRVASSTTGLVVVLPDKDADTSRDAS